MIRVIEDPSGTPLNTDYVFDTLGNLRKTTQDDQNRFFMHDSLGRLLYAKQVEQDTNSGFSATDPVTGNTAWSVKYEYDDNSNITKTTDAKGWYVEGTYDAFNRIKVRNYSDTATPDVSFYYDGIYKDASDTTQTATGAVKGKATGIKSSVSKTNYTAFDVFGRPTAHQQITDGNTYSTGYVYSLSGTLLEETYPSGRVVRNTFDENGDLAQIQSKKDASHGFFNYADSFAYGTSGELKKFQLGNGKWETFSYNNRQQITQIGLATTDSTTDLLKLEYKYDTTTTSHDNNGSLREQKITVPTVGSNAGFAATQTYTYDDLNRIQSATETISTTQTWKQTFDYDRYGNRRFNTSGSNTTTLGSCSTALCNPTISTSTNRISSSGYTFDANGNLTVDASGNQFSYDAENHQKEVKDSGNNSLGQYFYDGEGRRVKKIAGSETTIFVYDASGQMVAEYSTNLATTQQVSYLTQDHLGSQRIITNENGAVTDRKDHFAYGNEITSSQRISGLGYTSAEEPRKDFTGYEKDSESGLQFAQARFFNPTHGRFTSVDPLAASATIRNPQTFNRYSYVLNSPYKFVDPLGLLSQSTGACGNRCLNSDGGSGGGLGIGLYSDNGEAIQIGLVTVGNWSELTSEQHRLFTSYFVSRFGDPCVSGVCDDFGITAQDFAAVGWNNSAATANAGTSSANLLAQDQLTTFIGVTSMWERANRLDDQKGVSQFVAAVTEIEADNGDNKGFRLRGIFVEGGGQMMDKLWVKSRGMSKSDGTYKYEVSRREPGNNDAKGQFTMTKDLKRFDSDVDYHSVIGHLSHENSDIRREGVTTLRILIPLKHNHLTDHVTAYGRVPITIRK